MQIRVVQSGFISISADALLVFAFEDPQPFDPSLRELDSALGGALSRLAKSGEIFGKFREFHVLRPKQIAASHLIVLGAGKRNDFTADRLRSLAANGGRAARTLMADRVAFGARSAAAVGVRESASAAVEGLLLGLYRFRKYKTKPESRPEGSLREFVLFVNDKKDIPEAQKGAVRGEALAAAVNLARDMINEPSNVMTPAAFAEKAGRVAKESKLGIKVLEKARIEALRMGAFLSVAKGSAEPPKLVVLEYRGGGRGALTLGLVGKGVTFDSGGISIKPSEDMHHMTDDMAGAAACLAAVKAASELKLPLNITAVLPLAENLPDGKASKPGDIVSTHSGKTIEITNTDAEGRLLLADALSFMCEKKPDAVVDIATLTGGIRVALGQSASGIFSTNDRLRDEILNAARDCGEAVWPMPLYEDYSVQVKGVLADLRNSAGRFASPCTAAAFLKEFVGEVPWAHLDIAGTCRIDGDKTPLSRQLYLPKEGATGVGVRLLTLLAERLSRQKSSFL